jgi:hypothetical protein
METILNKAEDSLEQVSWLQNSKLRRKLLNWSKWKRCPCSSPDVTMSRNDQQSVKSSSSWGNCSANYPSY